MPASAGAVSKPRPARRWWRSRTASPSVPGVRIRKGSGKGGSLVTSAADELGELGHPLARAAGAAQPLLEPAVVEHHERRDAHDLVAAGGVGVVVDVELADGDLAFLF